MKNEDYKKFVHAKELIKNNKSEYALKLLEELFYENQKDINIKFELAKLYYRGNFDINEARRLLTELLFTKNKIYAKLELAILEKEQGNFEEARRLLTELVDDEFDSFAKFELGRLEKELGNYEESRRILTELVIYENNIYAIIELALLEKNHGNFEEARRSLTELVNNENNTYAMLELSILEREQGNFDESRRYLTKLNIDKKNENAMLELGRLESKIGNFEISRTILTKLVKNNNNVHAILELIYLDIKNMNFESAFQNLEKILAHKNKAKIFIPELNKINIFLKYKLGIIKDDKDNFKFSYFYEQLFDYNEEKAIEHIKLHLYENDKKKLQFIFDQNINIEELYENIKPKINDINPYNSTLVDKYILSFDHNIGTCNNKETNCIEVVTFSNTKDIITMYPIFNELGLNFKNKKAKKLIKTDISKTGIDKFNLKYGDLLNISC